MRGITVVERSRRPPYRNAGRLEVMFMCTCSVLMTSISYRAPVQPLPAADANKVRIARQHHKAHRTSPQRLNKLADWQSQ